MIVKAIPAQDQAAMKSHPLHGCLSVSEMNTLERWNALNVRVNKTISWDTTKEGGPIMMDMGQRGTIEQLDNANAVGMSDPANRLTEIDVDLAECEEGGTTMEEPTKVVVYVVDGVIQCVLATENVEVYVVEHDIRHDHGRHGVNTELYGLPVMLSRRKNVVAPRLVRKVVRAHRDVHC